MTTTAATSSSTFTASQLAMLNGGTSATSGTGSTSSSTSSDTSATSAQDQSDRFLKLLVAQMQNQDPLNPMDSAQVTSQMAQISTVEGVQTLNTTVSGLNAQFVQMQTMQGAGLVGHTVATEGNTLKIDSSTGAASAGFEVSSAATDVQVEIDDASGNKIDTLDLGAQSQGRHDFSYPVPDTYAGQALTFKVTATAGTTPVDSMGLTYNKISAVSNLNGQLALELDNGQRVSYDAVWAFI
jgi:flagellar basal-body rod modification protein FlgD